MKTKTYHAKYSSLAMLYSLVLTLFLSLWGTFSPVAVAAAAPVTQASVAPLAAGPTNVTIAGSLQSEAGCPGDWQPSCALTHMTKGAIDGVWRLSVDLPAGNYEYKAVLDDAWANGDYGLHAQPSGANIKLSISATTTVKFYYDPNSHWITDNINSSIVTAAGSFQSEIGCPGDWSPDCLKSWMEDIDGDGIYTFTTPVGLQNGGTSDGHFEWKAALNEGWAESYGDGGNNAKFNIPNAKAYAVLSFDFSKKLLSAEVKSKIPSQDNNVEYTGLGHDSRNSAYRVPFGAVNPGTPVTLRFRTFHNDVTGVTIRLYDTAIGHEDKQPMTLVARNVDCYNAALTADGSTCDFWQYTYTPQALGTTYYRFIVRDGSSTAYYADTANRYDGPGVATSDEQDNGFRLNTVDPKFKVIPWMQNGVMYQIFPDRFRNGDPANDPNPITEPRYDYPAPANASPAQIQAAADAQIQLRPWTALPEGVCSKYDASPTPCTETPKGRDYFGGDLKGVDQKLDYLKSVGITIIYFNPIFESGSNHGYDTRDFKTISHFFGTNNYFKKLVEDANDRGIRIVLDGVFNHLSSDSPFFDRYHHYTTVGACESPASPYRSWFIFHPAPLGVGPCAGDDANHSATYDGWAGFDSIPVIVKKDPANPTLPYGPVANYFYSNPKTSVAGFWLNRGISGWRFDVMTDPSFPASYWQQLRQITKGIDPDEILIAEAWHWYDNMPLTLGDQADTAMGYRFRNAVFGLLGAVDDKGFAEETNPNLPPSTFATRLNSMREDYSDATYYTFQNLLDSHDTKRVLWSLTPGNNNRQDKEFNAANVALGKARQDVAVTVQMTVPGTPTIYYGDEVALTGADDPDDRRPFPWTDLSVKKDDSLSLQQKDDGNQNDNNQDDNKKKDPYYGAGGDHTTLDLYRKLTKIRAAHPVLREGKLTFLLTDDTNKTLSYAMRKDNRLAIIVINRNETATQSVNVPLAGYLRDGVTLTDKLSGKGTVTSAGGSFAVSLAPLSAAIFLMDPNQTITGPAAPTGLSAIAQNGLQSKISLSWNAGAASYNLYRSPVKGGGYVKIASIASLSFVDSSVNNGTTYYYVVRGVDALGNEGANSNEATATPAFPIGYAVLQYPKTISHRVSSTPDTIYGQIYIQGLTDVSGEPGAILAQVGYGPTGSTPAGWTWQPMTYNSGHTGDNNYEYQGSIRADQAGTYDYLVRFSDDGGRNWVYGDQDGYVPGGSPGTNQPGVLTLSPSTDTTAPGTPVVSIDWSANSLLLSWTAATDPDDAVAEYRVFRGATAGSENPVAVAIVAGNVTSYVDTSVGSGQTYYYFIKAYDTSLNASGASNEVSHKVEAKLIQTTFRVKVPAFTPAGDTVYISGSPDPLCNYCGGNTPATAMTETAPGSHIWQITLTIPDGTAIQYKYTRGTYDYVEEWGSIKGFTNRVATVHANSPTDLTELFDDTSDTVSDDNHKAVQNWRDAAVAGKINSASSVTITFNWDVKPEGTDFNNAIAVTKGGVAVSGTISHNSANHSLTFTPATPLAAGSYTVVVDHVVSLTDANDGIKIRTPYSFSFNV